MPKYCVTIEEVISYDVTVEAADQEAAREEALAVFLDEEDLNGFPSSVDDRDITNVEEVA